MRTALLCIIAFIFGFAFFSRSPAVRRALDMTVPLPPDAGSR